MGFETNRFVDLNPSLAEELICSICLNVFDNAITCLAANCDHTFCKQCVENLINENNKSCPLCRNAFTAKRSHSSRGDKSLVIIGNNIFKTNRFANNIVNKQKIKCDFHSKGCKEVIQLSLLQTHLNECEFMSCKTCGMPFGTDDHNCLQLLITNRNEWRDKFNEIIVKNSNLEKEVKKFKNNNSKLNRRLSELRKTNTELRKEILDSQQNDEQSDGSSQESSDQNYLELIGLLKRNSSFRLQYVYFGLFRDQTEWDINFGYEIKFKNKESEISIDYKSIEEFMYCLDPTNSMIILKPFTQLITTSNSMQSIFRSKFWFDVESDDRTKTYIIIKMDDNFVEKSVLLAKCYSKLFDVQLNCEAIDKGDAGQLVVCAQNKWTVNRD